ncbi:ABC transporter ATP-binding protein [Sphingomonas sp. LHG3406-1]|uniref:ATP-binding cassette domain-containing protein n=1 Tax=Sphingomonas sp. LHG3406-1 TaxID=2804617 RepID=UPI002610F902|nr:ABC transporter ATP-binding protein [Sphingomonas sp. LHG3406-1]
MIRSWPLLAEALGPGGRRGVVLLTLLTIAGGIAEFATIAALLHLLRGWLADSEIAGGALLLFAGAVLAAGAIRFGLLAATQRLAFGTGHRLLVAVQRKVLARDWQTHVAARESGPLAAADLVEQWLFGGLLPLLQAGAALVLAAGILAGLLWVEKTAAIAAALLLGTLFVAATLIVRPAARRSGEMLGRGYEERVAVIQENVGALRELILAGARGEAAERFRRIDRRLADARTSAVVASGTPRILVETFGLIALALVAWAIASREGGLIAALPTLAALGLGAQRLLPLLQTISQASTGLAASRSVNARIAMLLDGPELVEEPPPEPLPFNREIRLERLGFGYGGRDQPALSGIDLVIRRGARVALTGPNGSGKSTLADLVMGLLPPREGRVLIDGVMLGPELMASWQRNVAHVPQAPFVADASIARNIALFAGAPDMERIREAVRLAGLGEFVASLPDGLDSRVGSGGQLLSGGQRQRLALARALYAPAPLLVLDEATSALDPDSERVVLRALDALQQRGTTILLIAHRETMLEGCDQVVRLEGGKLVAV